MRTACLTSNSLVIAFALGCVEPPGDSQVGESGSDGEVDCCQPSQPEDHPDCVAAEGASVTATMMGPLDGLCTVTSVQVGPPGQIALECPMGAATLSVETTPAWVPTLEVDASVLAVADDNTGGAKGTGYTYRTFRLLDADTQAVILAYSWGEIPAPIDEFLEATAIEAVCHTVCEDDGFDGSRRAALRFSAGADEITLFQGHAGMLGPYELWVGNAYDYPDCSVDQMAGLYEWFAAAAP